MLAAQKILLLMISLPDCNRLPMTKLKTAKSGGGIQASQNEPSNAKKKHSGTRQLVLSHSPCSFAVPLPIKKIVTLKKNFVITVTFGKVEWLPMVMEELSILGI
jgi:hypothetical protein